MLKSKPMTYTIEVELEDEVLEVELEAYPIVQNDGIGRYEYWGSKGYDAGVDYLTLEDSPTYDKSLYTEEEQKVIDKYLADNEAKIEELICKEYQDQSI